MVVLNFLLQRSVYSYVCVCVCVCMRARVLVYMTDCLLPSVLLLIVVCCTKKKKAGLLDEPDFAKEFVMEYNEDGGGKIEDSNH